MKKTFKNIFAAAFFLFSAVNILSAATVTKKQSESAEVIFVQKLSNVLESGSIDKAIAMFDTMPDSMKNDKDMRTLQASLLLSAGNDSESSKIAAELLTANPNDLGVLELNVMIAKKKGDAKAKSALIKRILAIQPKNAAANVELADEQALKHNYRNARDLYKKALLSEPENLEALFGFGKMSYYMEKDDDAESSFKKLLELDPQNAQALLYLGKLEGEDKRYLKAREYVLAALKADPNNADAYFDLGTYSRYMGKWADAENAWKKTTELEPDYFLGYAMLAGLYDEQNKTDKALEYYRLVVEKNPNYFYAYESLGMFAWKAGNWEEAGNAFMKALEHNPDSLSYKLFVAACYLKLNKPQLARKFTEEKMRKLDRQSLEYAMVRLYHDMGGDTPLILKVQKEENSTKRGRYLFYLALYYDLSGNFDLAQKFYNSVVEMQAPMFFEYRMAQWATGSEK